MYYSIQFHSQDSAIKDGKVVLDLIDSIKPGTINYDIYKDGGAEEVRFLCCS